MDTNRNSVESQLRTRCNILESQVETLEKQKSSSPEKFTAKNDAQAEQWKEVAGVGRFPA
jgi:chaperonin cofactor prefoldin